MSIDPKTDALDQVRSILREFDCVEGDRRSYHTTADGDIFRYVTLGFQGAALHDVTAAMFAALKALRESMRGKATLYLRCGPEIEREFENKDWHMRIRLAIPGADWSKVITKPEGLPYPKV